MKIPSIAALPVADFADKDCCLFMWATWPRLEAALEVGHAWGFRYVTDAFLWAKTNPTRGDSFLTRNNGWHFGLGYWTRANTEPCLLFRIERLVEGPYLELFARNKRSGWASWGNEIESDIQLTVEGVA
jgi:N6-adenosine-specific RNA methylase IME4